MCRFPRIVSFDEHQLLLRVSGDEDRATQSLRRRPLSRAICSCVDDVTVDLSELTWCDPSLLLDLAMVARRKLEAAGVTQIEHVDLCTSCRPDLFSSHRRDNGVTGRQAGIAWLT